MLALLGSLLGFGSSFLPKVVEIFQDKQDKKHELAMMDKQLAHAEALQEHKMQAVEVEAAVREIEVLHREHASITRKSSQWVVNLSSTVRPIVTYAFFLEFALLTLAVFQGWVSPEQYSMIWNAEMQAIWAAVISFWFGQRTFGKR